MRFNKTSIAWLTALCVILTWPLTSNAEAQNQSLFRSEVIIQSQQERDLKRALPLAFRKTLIKLTADPAIGEQPWAKQALLKSKNYVLQYRYELRTENLTTDPETRTKQPETIESLETPNHAPASEQTEQTEQRPPNTTEVLYLICEFNQQAVTGLFEEFGIAYWGRSRPTLVTWLLHDSQNQRQIADNDHPEYGSLLPEISERYGLNLVLPLMDLQEQAEVTISNLWLRDTGLLKQVSKRYSSEGYLLAQVHSDQNGQWSGEWFLSINDQKFQWPVQHAADLDSLLHQGIDAISDQIFALYSHRPLTIHATSEIHIGAINNMQRYQQVWDYLGDLSGVQHVLPLNFDAGQASFTIEHSGDWSELTRLIDLEGTLSSSSPNLQNRDQSVRHGFNSALPNTLDKRFASGAPDYSSADGHLYSQPKQRYTPEASTAAVPVYYLTQ